MVACFLVCLVILNCEPMFFTILSENLLRPDLMCVLQKRLVFVSAKLLREPLIQNCSQISHRLIRLNVNLQGHIAMATFSSFQVP